MYFPDNRPRRLRSSGALREIVRETALRPEDLIYPLFIVHGEGITKPISSMPGIYQHSIDSLLEELKEVVSLWE